MGPLPHDLPPLLHPDTSHISICATHRMGLDLHVIVVHLPKSSVHTASMENFPIKMGDFMQMGWGSVATYADSPPPYITISNQNKIHHLTFVPMKDLSTMQL